MSTSANRMEVANEILKQLGGNQFLAMTGSHSLAAGPNMLCMKLRRNSSKANYLRITLNSMDTYDVAFIKIYNMKLTTIKAFEGLYNDQLRKTFEEVTVMYTSL